MSLQENKKINRDGMAEEEREQERETMDKNYLMLQYF